MPMKHKGKRERNMQAIIHNGSSEVNPEPYVFRNAATSARGFVVCEGLLAVGNTGNRGADIFPFPYHELHKRAVEELEPDWRVRVLRNDKRKA